MKLLNWLNANIQKLEQAGISTARLDCLVLLEDALDQNRSWLLAHPDQPVQGSTLHRLDEQIERRTRHEPLAYIRGKSEFYGREFIINHHTLQPRPETETMIELLKQLVESRKLKVESPVTYYLQPTTNQRLHGSDAAQGEAEQQADAMLTIVDVGTGSGCIAITTKILYPHVHVIATDIDKKCLNTAKQNAKKLGTKITFYHGNLLEPLTNTDVGFTYADPEADFSLSSGVRRMSDTAHEQRKGKTGSGPQTNSRIASPASKQAVGDTWILLANLPYVPDSHTINPAAMHEPPHAIFGGADGLDYYRSLFKQLELIDIKPRFIFTEAMPPQHGSLESIAQLHNYQLTKKQDFIQVFSFIETTVNKNT